MVAVVDRALSKQGITTKAVERWKEEMPVEQEMVPKDKYTIFDRKEKKYRKSIRSELLRNELLEGEWELMILQSCRSGRESHNESILLGTDQMDLLFGTVYHSTLGSIKERRSGWDVHHKGDRWQKARRLWCVVHRIISTMAEISRLYCDRFISQVNCILLLW